MIRIKKKQSAPGLWMFHGTPGTSGGGGTEVVEAQSWTETWLDGSKVVITWTAPIAGFDAALSTYSIYKNGNFLVSVPSSTNSYDDTAVMSGTTYTYTVNLNYVL